jgi:hypothetical protein
MITFANGKTYETVRIMGGTETFQGQQRKTLAIDIVADLITLDEAKALYKDAAALSELTVETAGETSVQLNFTLPVELKVHELTTGENGETTEVVTIKVAQKSSLEIAQEQQAQDIEDANAALIELAGIVAGGVDNG